MSDDLIIVVPTGTRVRYVESPGIHEVFAIDFHALENNAVEYEPWLTNPPALTGLPVYDAERYEP